MCRTCGPRKTTPPRLVAQPSAAEKTLAPGDQGFVWLRYTGKDAKTEYGAVTGARYPFWEVNERPVDAADAAAFLARGDFAEVKR